MRIFGGNDNFENVFCASLRDFFFPFYFGEKVMVFLSEKEFEKVSEKVYVLYQFIVWVKFLELTFFLSSMPFSFAVKLWSACPLGGGGVCLDTVFEEDIMKRMSFTMILCSHFGVRNTNVFSVHDTVFTFVPNKLEDAYCVFI